MKHRNDLGTDPVLKLVLRLAIPTMIAQLVSVLYGIVDRMYIGNIPLIGNTALAGVGVCGPITTLLSSFASLVGLGGAPLMAMRMGEKNQKGAEQILANCFLMLAGLSALLTTLFLIFRNQLLFWFGASAETFPYAESYLTIYTAGTFFALLATGLNSFIICQGHSMLGMCSVMLGAVTNIVLDPIFIFPLGMGVAGAAWATVLSQIASCVFVLAVLLGRKIAVRITFRGYSWKIMRRVISFGFSPFLIIATDSVLLIVMNAVLQRYGGPELGDRLITCATIVQSYMMLITMPMGGITGGTQPILSYNYGAKQTARIREGIRWILLLCIVFTVLMFLLSRFVPQYFAGIFTQDAENIRLSVWGIQIFTLSIIPLAFQYVFVDGLTALGKVRFSVSFSLFRKSLFFACTLLFPAVWGAASAFYAEPVADLAAALVTSTGFLFLFKRLMKQREEMKDGESLYS